MSSHHFVKEQQEPALLLLDTAQLSYEQIAPLLEWVPTVLVAEPMVERVLSWGIKIDVILATREYQKAHFNLLEEQYPLRFLTCPSGDYLQEGRLFLCCPKSERSSPTLS